MAGLGNSMDDEEMIAGINVTPLVDIALVLLIIFIATSAIIVRAAINAELPSAASAGEVLPQSVSIVIDSDGRLFLNGEPTNHENLGVALRAEAAANPETRALIAADRGLVYDHVVRVIDVVRLSGLSGFSLNVQRVPVPAAAEPPAAAPPETGSPAAVTPPETNAPAPVAPATPEVVAPTPTPSTTE